MALLDYTANCPIAAN